MINTDLANANLNRTDLRGTDLSGAHLTNATFVGASLRGTNFSWANLRDADLRGTQAKRTIFTNTRLDGVSLKNITVGKTRFVGVDLSTIKDLSDLENANHVYPSFLSTDTIARSKGLLPKKFLRGVGLHDWEINMCELYKPELTPKDVEDIIYRIFETRVQGPIRTKPLFLSYCHEDKPFVDALDAKLVDAGILFWRDTKNAGAGRLDRIIEEAIQDSPIVLVVLSKHSVKAPWVEHEIATAIRLARDHNQSEYLCPISLDDEWKSSTWSGEIQTQIRKYNVLSFAGWKDEGTFIEQFRLLLKGLKLYE